MWLKEWTFSSVHHTDDAFCCVLLMITFFITKENKIHWLVEVITTLIYLFLIVTKIFKYFIFYIGEFRLFQYFENNIKLKKNSKYVTITVTMNVRKSCRQFRKKTLKTEVRTLKILMKNVHVFIINVLNIFFLNQRTLLSCV